MCEKNVDLMPKGPAYFKEEIISELIPLYSNKPSISNLLNFLIFPEIVATVPVKTLTAKSEEGTKLNGVKLMIHLKLTEKLTYTSKSINNAVHAAHYEHYKSISIILPKNIKEFNTIDLIKCNRFKASVFMEKNHTRLFNDREVFNCGLLFVNIKFCI